MVALPLSPLLTLVLLTSGALLIFVELNRPGLVVPGCLGLLAMLLAAASIGRGQDSVAGLAGLSGAIAIAVADTRWPRGTILALLAGAIAMVFWAVTRGEALPWRIAALGLAILLAGLTHWLARIAAVARRNKSHRPHSASAPETF